MEELKEGHWIATLKRTLTDYSVPVFSSEEIEGISLRKIHEIESVKGRPVTLIAVTRKEYDNANFDKFEKYIKNVLGYKRVYYGLFFNGERVEHDVLYAIPTDNPEQIEYHLNAHTNLNHGVAQLMALVIESNGNMRTVRNSLINAF